MRIGFAVARVVLLLGGRSSEIRRLFARTAAAFGREIPVPQVGGPNALLREYARFTREQAEAAMAAGSDLRALRQRLHDTGLELGKRYGRRLSVRTFPGAVAAARLIYCALGIDFRCDPGGQVEIRRCGFAASYAPCVCALMSALDRGLIAGLTTGGELQFHQRLTEGASACRGCITGAGI